MKGVLRRLNSGSGVIDAATCPVCKHPARLHNRVGCVFGPCECRVTVGALNPDAPTLEAPDGVEPTPPAPPTQPAPAPVAAPAPAVASTVEAGPGREQAAPQPVTRPVLPGAGIDLVPRDEAEVDAIVAAGRAEAARKMQRRSSPRTARSALGYRAVVSEDDAQEAAVAASTVAAAAEPLDLAPFLNASITYYAAWYCTHCYQRRHDPGACPDCDLLLVPVYVAIVPRETS